MSAMCESKYIASSRHEDRSENRTICKGVTAAPRLPAHWQRLRFKLFHHGKQREFVFDDQSRQ
jgi:hypothetical protein